MGEQEAAESGERFGEEGHCWRVGLSVGNWHGED